MLVCIVYYSLLIVRDSLSVIGSFSFVIGCLSFLICHSLPVIDTAFCV